MAESNGLNITFVNNGSTRTVLKKKSCKFAGCSKQIDLFQRFYSTKFILYHLIDLRFSKCCMDTLAKKTKKQTSKQTLFVISGSFIFVIKHDKYFCQTFWPFYYLINLRIYTRYVLPTPPLTMLFARPSLAHQEIQKRNWQFALVK